jgi:hypothetical protein
MNTSAMQGIIQDLALAKFPNSSKVLHPLGLKSQDLISVFPKMHAANNKNIKILGTAILRYSVQDRKNNVMVNC